MTPFRPAFLHCLLLVFTFGLGVAQTVQTAQAAAEVSIERVFTGWREAASFKRISEYFTGRENTGGQIVLRTDPAQRAGYYFLIRTEQDAATEAKVRLTYFLPGQTDPKVLTFPVRLSDRTAAINLGLTGDSWPDPEVSAVAWRIEILSADESRVLATERSYLWNQPGAEL